MWKRWRRTRECLGYQVQEFFKRLACVAYQMLVKQQLNPAANHSGEQTSTKTQLAIHLNSSNGNSSTAEQ